MKTVAPMKSSEIRALLEGKRDEINLLLPTVAPAVGLARVERDGDNYIMRIASVSLCAGHAQ
jgi:hypothetical protein